MALNLFARYPGQVDSDPTNYPYGKARNVNVTGDGTGTPFEKDLVNDIFGFLQALLLDAGIVPNGIPDAANYSQYLTALHEKFAPASLCTVAAGKKSAALSKSATSAAPVEIPGFGFSIPGLNANDLVNLDIFFSMTMFPGAYSGVNVVFLDNQSGTVTETFSTHILTSSDTHVVSCQHQIVTGGTCVIDMSMESDGTNSAQFGNSFIGNNLYCRYSVVRP